MKISGIILAVLAALMFQASRQGVALAADAGMLKMRFTQSGNTSSSWPLYVAEQKKIFDKNGIQVETIIIRGATNVVRAVLSETVPIGRINPDYVIGAIEKAYATWNKRVPTSALNRWFEQATRNNPPPAVSGRRLKLNYVTQTKARPPSFVVFCSRADAVPQSYLRYLTNTLREAFDLPGTPVRITLREKANPFAHKAKRKS